jgi:hypothetical protein
MIVYNFFFLVIPLDSLIDKIRRYQNSMKRIFIEFKKIIEFSENLYDALKYTLNSQMIPTKQLGDYTIIYIKDGQS